MENKRFFGDVFKGGSMNWIEQIIATPFLSCILATAKILACITITLSITLFIIIVFMLLIAIIIKTTQEVIK